MPDFPRQDLSSKELARSVRPHRLSEKKIDNLSLWLVGSAAVLEAKSMSLVAGNEITSSVLPSSEMTVSSLAETSDILPRKDCATLDRLTLQSSWVERDAQTPKVPIALDRPNLTDTSLRLAHRGNSGRGAQS